MYFDGRSSFRSHHINTKTHSELVMDFEGVATSIGPPRGGCTITTSLFKIRNITYDVELGGAAVSESEYQ